MSDNRHKRPLDDLAKLQEALADAQKKSAEWEATERKRRAALTTAQREEEDRNRAAARELAAKKGLAQWLLKMGARVLARESWTMDQFAWLLVGEDPTKRGAWWDLENDRAAEEQRVIRGVLESWVGVSIKPVNPEAAAKEWRFVASELLRKAYERQMGHAAVLKGFIEANFVQPKRRPHSDTPPQAEVAQSIPIAKQGIAWRHVIATLCAEIELAAKAEASLNFKRDPLPWSTKTLYRVAESRHAAAGYGRFPVNVDTFRKHLNRAHGWKSKAGHQDRAADAWLRKRFTF